MSFNSKLIATVVKCKFILTLTFAVIVGLQRHVCAEVREIFNDDFLQIFDRCQWEKIEKRSIFHEFMTKLSDVLF